MPDVSKRILTDETGQDIVTALTALTNVVDPNGTAVAAAAKINGLTVTMSPLSATASPTATLSEVDNHYHLALAVPIGLPAVTSSNNGQILKVIDGVWAASNEQNISLFAPKANPVFTGSISMGRLTNSTVGSLSVALGENAVASGTASVSIGGETEAYGICSTAIGYQSIAHGDLSFALGYGVVADSDEFVVGRYNYINTNTSYEWVPGNSYAVYDTVRHNYTMYECITANSDTEWNDEHWSAYKSSDGIFTVGYGADANNRRNLFQVSLDTNGHFNGSVYVNCNADSTGGKKLATEEYVSTSISNISLMTGCSSSTAGVAGLVPAPVAGEEDKFLSGDGTYKSGGLPMVILSYGNSTWQDFINAYKNNVIVYCRASSNANPKTGSQTRMAFMAYVSDATNPTNVEFQYYRSMNPNNKTINQLSDQVYVYKLTSAGAWSVEVREASIKSVVFDASSGLTGTYDKSTGTLTISAAT